MGCGEGALNSSKVHFAGEIVNPTSKHVVLLKGDRVIDSAQLDATNRFAFNFDSLPTGLYHFNHSPELQYIYLEPGDSITIRLNTIDFDESLAFSGKGSEISSFLLEVFLAKEAEAPLINAYYTLEAGAFSLKIDSLKKSKMDMLGDLKSDGEVSGEEEAIALASISYTYNTFMEKYPFKHKQLAHQGVMESLPKGFYSYRKSLDYGDEKLVYLRPYYNFMQHHIQNRAYMDCSEKCAVNEAIVRDQLHFNQHKMRMIDSLVTAKELKDNLYRYVAFDYLLKVHDTEENNRKFIEEFHELSQNNKHLEEIDNLYHGIENIQPNKFIPELYVSSMDGDTISLREISEKGKTVFYFWSGSEKRHFNNIKARITKLSEEHPRLRYVGINMKTNEPTWKAMVERSGLDKSLQFRADDFEELTKSLIIYPPNKCVITEDAKIVDAFANIYSEF